jgi:predicted nucleotidyltransferase
LEAVVDERLGSLGSHTDQEWTQPADSTSGEDVLQDVVRAASDSLGERLVAAYAMGSLAHGGFSPSVSDVDAGLILADPIQESDADAVVAVAEHVRSIGSPLHERVSVFWGTAESFAGHADGGRFPPLDRLCLLEHGRLLTGSDVRSGLTAPTQTELLVAGARFALELLADDVVACAHQPDRFVEGGIRWTTKLVLFPARFVLTAQTGREGTNEAAVQHYSELSGAPGAALVRAAFDWRTNPPTIEHALAMLADDFVPLYDYYLTDYTARLESIGESELAAGFNDWRSRLLAEESNV